VVLAGKEVMKQGSKEVMKHRCKEGKRSNTEVAEEQRRGHGEEGDDGSDQGIG
jgi:hypothetical protein